MYLGFDAHIRRNQKSRTVSAFSGQARVADAQLTRSRNNYILQKSGPKTIGSQKAVERKQWFTVQEGFCATTLMISLGESAEQDRDHQRGYVLCPLKRSLALHLFPKKKQAKKRTSRHLQVNSLLELNSHAHLLVVKSHANLITSKQRLEPAIGPGLPN